MSIQPKRRYSPDEYLALERESDAKHEYLDGEIFAMGGASPRHVLIVANVTRELGNRLRASDCMVFSTDLRVRVSEDGLYTYPDVVVACGAPEFHDDRRDTLTNPRVIVEVLSKSTQDYDRGQKFEPYRRIASLAEYVLVAQDRPHVEHFTKRPDGTWVLEETNDRAAGVDLTSLGCRLELADVYAKVDALDA